MKRYVKANNCVKAAEYSAKSNSVTMIKKFKKFPVSAGSQVEDAGMILEVFQNAVDEVILPEGYEWDYKIDQLDNGEPAGQIFIMTDDNQPVMFLTFNLTKNGAPLNIVGDDRLYRSLVTQLRKFVKELGDLSLFAGNPAQKTIMLSNKIRKSKITATPYNLGRYSKYYEDAVAGFTSGKQERYLENLGNDYGYEFIGYVDAKPKYVDIFGDYASAAVFVDSHTGKLKVCQVINDLIFEISINELEDLIDEYTR